jgi:solute carrier family 25 (mitochondrial iron transporter), member 28/37
MTFKNITNIAHAAYFSIFETTRVLYGADREGHQPIRAALCGASAALGHDLCMTPFDTVKQRMQLGYYKSVSHCITTVARAEGFRAFYMSLPTTLMMNLPYGCVMVAVNESSKKALNPQGGYNFGVSMIAGSIGGAAAAALTTPIDLIKTKIQTQNLEPCPRGGTPVAVVVDSVTKTVGDSSGNSTPTRDCSTGARSFSSSVLATTTGISSGPGAADGTSSRHLKGALDVIRLVHKEYGMMGFMRGMGPRMLVHAPAGAISWTTYEAMKSLLANGVGHIGIGVSSSI